MESENREERSGRGRPRPQGGAVIVVCIVLFGALIVGGVLALTIYTVKRSPAYRAAESFVRNNPEIQAVVGKDIELGWIPKSSIDASANEGSAEFRMTAKGSAGKTQVLVLASSKGGQWSVVSARYRGRDGVFHTVAAGQPHPAAFSLYKNGDYAGAAREYTKAIASNPRDAEAYYWRGVAYKNLQKWDEAAADLKAAIEIAPTQMPAYENLDEVLAARQAWDPLIAYWTKLIQLQPENGQAYYYRAGGYLRKGDRANAVQDAQKSCELGSSDGCRTLEQMRRR